MKTINRYRVGIPPPKPLLPNPNPNPYYDRSFNDCFFLQINPTESKGYILGWTSSKKD